MTYQRRVQDDEDPVRTYLADVGRHALLTKDDEVLLAQRIEHGNAARELLQGEGPHTAAEASALCESVRRGEEAQRTFVQSNLRLVVSIAKRYQGSGVPLLDLIQEGNLGLMHAVEKFEWRRGFKFSTYATWWIRQAITRGIANVGRTIRLPVDVGELLRLVNKARASLETQLGRSASLAELAAEVETSEEKIMQLLRVATEPVSLSSPLSEDSDAMLGDVLEDPSDDSPVAETALLALDIERLFEPLDERERRVLVLHYGLDRGAPRTLEQVGKFFGLTRERIRQIEAVAMTKLRERAATSAGAWDLLAV